jgi:hypothetical protein
MRISGGKRRLLGAIAWFFRKLARSIAVRPCRDKFK